MVSVIVAGHGHFASGIVSALELILGEQEKLQIVDFPFGDTLTELENNIDKAIKHCKNSEHIIFFCDLYSGSPFNTATIEAIKDPRIDIIYGTNLGMLVEFMMSRAQGKDYKELMDSVVKTGESQIGIFSKEKVDGSEDEFDEFDA